MQVVTLCISTTMVLILLGLVVLSVLTARNLSDYVRENMAVNLVLGDTVTVDDGMAMMRELKAQPFAKDVKYISTTGITSDQPFSGANIKVITFSDGSKKTVKVMK